MTVSALFLKLNLYIYKYGVPVFDLVHLLNATSINLSWQ